MPANPKAWMALAFEGRRQFDPGVSIPRRFKVERARLLEENAPAVFGWVMHASGSHLLDPSMPVTDLASWQAHFEIGCADDESYRYYWFDGDTLELTTVGRLFARLSAERGDP